MFWSSSRGGWKTPDQAERIKQDVFLHQHQNPLINPSQSLEIVTMMERLMGLKKCVMHYTIA